MPAALGHVFEHLQCNRLLCTVFLGLSLSMHSKDAGPGSRAWRLIPGGRHSPESPSCSTVALSPGAAQPLLVHSSAVAAGNEAQASACFPRGFDTHLTLIEDLCLKIVGAGGGREL